MFDPNAISQGHLHALREAAENSWADDTRHSAYQGHPQPSAGQCYVTSRWLTSRLGGSVARKDGHYFWLSPEKSHAIDLTGDNFAFKPEHPTLQGIRLNEHDPGLELEPHQLAHRPGPMLYKETTHPYFAGAEVMPDEDDSDAAQRTDRFVRRADAALDNLGTSKVAIDVGDALPAQEPQAIEDTNQRYLHDEPNYRPEPQEYNFVYGQGHLHLSPDHSHEELASHADIPVDHTGPFAVGYVTVNMNTATWQAKSNIALKALQRVFKDYCKQTDWQWGGLTDINGQPISDEFGPKKRSTFTYVWSVPYKHLFIGRGYHHYGDLIKAGGYAPAGIMQIGTIEVTDGYAHISHLTRANFEALNEWAQDERLVLVAGNDNVIKTIEDLEMKNIYSPQNNEPEGTQFFHEPRHDERAPGGVFKCPECKRIFPRWDLYIQHRQDEEPPGEPNPETDHQPDMQMPDMDDTFPAHFTEQDNYRIAVHPAGLNEARRVAGFHRYARAFDYDNDDHRHYVAYHNGCPIGTGSVSSDGELKMIQAAVKGKGVMHTILDRIECHYPQLVSAISYDWQKEFLERRGWVNVRHHIWTKRADVAPKDAIEAPIPFIYDIDQDKIEAGQPGQRHSDIVGRFTPAGIVEGTYEPGGKVIIRTMTNMPYTVRHMLELFYYTHPQLEVKSVHLRDDSGKDTKLASREVGGYISSMVAADPAAWAAKQALQQAGGRVYAVGGAVRDALLGHEPKDIDLMVNGLPAESVRKVLGALPGRTDLTGKDFGVFRYRQGKEDVEIALPRRERSTGAGHQDFEVQADHTMPVEQDLSRRDFTPNAMAVDLNNGRLIDPHGGADDIEAGQYRTLSDKSLADDPLRTVRSLVLHGRYGLDPDEDTKQQMALHADRLSHLPPERIQAELDKLFASHSPEQAIRLAHETGVLKHIFPEVDAAFGYDQNNPHHERELGEHLLSVLEQTAQQSADPDLRLAALYHDVGKPASAWVDPQTGSNHYYEDHYVDPDTGQALTRGADHEQVGADMVQDRMRELKYPTARIDRVNDLVQNHMFPAFTSPKGARRFLNRVGDHADDLMTLRRADQGGKSEYPTDPSLSLDTQRNLIDQVRNSQEATSTAGLAINGHDLIAAGITPGPAMGALLNRLTTAVVDDPSLNTKDQLLSLAQEYARMD